MKKAIEKWVPIVNGEYGLSDRNEITVTILKHLIPYMAVIEDERQEWYVAYSISPDLWGNKELRVISLYVKPGKSRAYHLLKIMRIIERTAKAEGCKRILMGCHLGDRNKFNKFLRGIGFKPQSFIKEV